MLVVSKADELLRQGGGRKNVLHEAKQALKSDTYRGFDSCLVSKWGFEGLNADQRFNSSKLDEDKLQKDIQQKVEAAAGWLRAEYNTVSSFSLGSHQHTSSITIPESVADSRGGDMDEVKGQSF